MNSVFYTIQDWQQVPAGLAWLTDAERARYGGFRFDKRRRDWLLGRWTAKLALLGMIELPDRDIARFEIASASDGAPLPLLDGEPYRIGLSLSHSNGRAFCTVSADTMALGCDIERVATRSASFAETFFTAAECEWIDKTEPRLRDALITLIWSAKESALKTLRHGLRVDTRSVEVEADGEFAANAWQSARILAADEGAFSGWWRMDGASIFTIVARPPVAMPVAQETGATMLMKQTPESTGRRELR